MGEKLQAWFHRHASSWLVLLTCMLVLHIANWNLQSADSFSSSFNEATNQQLINLQLEAPDIQEIIVDGVPCSRIVMRGALADKQMGAPQLPRRSLRLPVPEGLTYKNFRLLHKTSSPLPLNYPLCINPVMMREESFIDDAVPSGELIVDKNAKPISLPYPSSPLKEQSIPRQPNSEARLYFLLYPVIATSPLSIEVISEITYEINYNATELLVGANSKLISTQAFTVPTDASLRISVASAGAYEVSGAILNNIPANTSPSQVRVWYQGEELAREVTSSGANISAIRFFMPSFEKTYYNDQAKVWINWSGGTGIDLQIQDGDPALQSSGTSTYPQTDEYYSYSRSWNSLPISDGVDADGDPIPPGPKAGYAYRQLQYAPSGLSLVNYSFTPKSRVVANSEVSITSHLRGLSYYDVNPDHGVEFYLNGNLLGSRNFDGQAYVAATYATTTTLNSGSNSLGIKIPGGLVSGYESIAFYGFDVTYQREMAALSDYLDFTVSQAGSYTIKDFTQSSVRIFQRLSHGVVKELHNIDVAAQVDSTYHASFSTNSAGQFYAIANNSFKTPAASELDTTSTLQSTTTGAQYIVIAGNGLLSGAAALADYRHSQSGYSTMVVDVQDIFDEYSYGEVDPKAVRRFLLDGWQHWQIKPKYLILVGDATNDPLGLLSSANRTNNKLPHFFDTSFYITIPNDSRFAFLTGAEPVPDLAVGRLPVTTNDQVFDYISKLHAYETTDTNANWASRIQLVSDNFNEPSANWEQPFISTMDWVKSHTPTDYSIDHIDLRFTDGVTARQNLSDHLNDGMLFLYYMGHSTTSMWAAEQLLTSSSVSSLSTALPALPFVASMTCLTGTFNSSSETSLAEALLLATDKGATGVFASSGLTVPDAQALLAEHILDYLYQYRGPIGMVLRNVRENLHTVGLDDDVARSYNYLGDPGLTLHFKATQPLPTETSNAASNLDSGNDNTGSTPSIASTSSGANGGLLGGCGRIAHPAPAESLPALGYYLVLMLGLAWYRRRLSHNQTH